MTFFEAFTFTVLGMLAGYIYRDMRAARQLWHLKEELKKLLLKKEKIKEFPEERKL